MAKPFCKMSLKELLEHLRSASQEPLEEVSSQPVRQPEQLRMSNYRKIGTITMDEAVYQLIVHTGGVHPQSMN